MPLILQTLLRASWPYLVAFAVGFGSAWWLQGLRVTEAKQALVTYKQEQKDAIQNAKDAAEKARLTQEKDYANERKKLLADIEAGNVYRRCVAAGKCGVRVVATCANPIPASVGTHGPSPDAIPVAGGSEAAIAECAQTTLQLNKLQASIEAQPGY